MADHTTTTKRKREDQDPDSNFSKLIKLSEAEVIYVKVGSPKSKTFIVHKDPFCKQSPLFHDFGKKTGTPGERRVLELPDQLPLFFEGYMHWVYTIAKDIASSGGPHVSRMDDIRTVVEFWLMGDIMKDAAFKNQAMRALTTLPVEDHKTLFNPSMLKRIGRRTSRDSRLRDWLLHHLVEYMTTGYPSDDDVLWWPPKLLARVLQTVATRFRCSRMEHASFVNKVGYYLEAEGGA